MLAVDFDTQGLLVQPVPVTGVAGQFGHVLAHHVTGKVTVGFVVAPVDVRHDPFKGHVHVPHATEIIFVVEVELFTL